VKDERSDDEMSGVLVRDLHKSFGAHPVLRGVDLEVASSSVTAILGPSGSGKTTLLRVLAGFERQDRGTIKIGDRVVDDGSHHVRPEKRKLGYVPQEGSLFPHLTVEANVGFGLPRAKRKSVGELLEMVGLGELAKRYPHQLSGGQQQRVALARALAVAPDVVLLDEPFASLDTQLRAKVREEVHEMLRTAGTTALLVTHDQDEALSMADTVAVLRAGRIAQCAAPRELYLRPADPDVAHFVGDSNLVEGVADGETVVTPFGRAPADWGGEVPAPSESVTVLVRPEQLEIVAEDAVARVVGVPGRIEHIDYHGHDAVVQVRADGMLGGRLVVVRTGADTEPAVESRVTLVARGPLTSWTKKALEGTSGRA
jgi:iron(III) transport system ATP-binding protein